MKFISKILAPGLLFLFLSSCYVHEQTVSSKFTPVSAEPCTALQPGHVLLLFEGDSANFKYKEIGLVEATGLLDNGDGDIRNKLKYEARQHCADAVINIRTKTVSRNGGEKNIPILITKQYKGLAVKMEPDSTFSPGNLADWQDTSFVSQVALKNHKKRVPSTIRREIILGSVLVFLSSTAIEVIRLEMTH